MKLTKGDKVYVRNANGDGFEYIIDIDKDVDIWNDMSYWTYNGIRYMPFDLGWGNRLKRIMVWRVIELKETRDMRVLTIA